MAFNGLGAQGRFLLGNWLLGRWGPAHAPTRFGRGGAKAIGPKGHPGRDTAGFPLEEPPPHTHIPPDLLGSTAQLEVGLCVVGSPSAELGEVAYSR